MYRMGLDIGTTSVGFSVLAVNSSNEPYRIIDLGSRIFTAAENPKTGASLALPRREARGARRRGRRKAHRIERIKRLIVREGILTKEELDQLFTQPLSNIYAIRYEALNRVLSDAEWARLLLHLAKHRGFKSNRRVEAETDQEAGKLLSAVTANKELMRAKNYLTVGEMLFRDEKFADHKRNKTDDYSNTMARSILVDEIKILFDRQEVLGNPHADAALLDAYLSIYTSQRSFEEGPGGESPYGGNQIEKMIGTCTFEPNEPRAAQATYTYEYWNLLQNINRLTINDGSGKKRSLTPTQRVMLDALAHDVENLNMARVRKALQLDDNDRFVGLTYGEKSPDEVEKKAKFQYLKAYHAMRRAFNKIKKDLILTIPIDIRDAVGEILSRYKTDETIVRELKALDSDWITEPFIQAVLSMPSFRKFGNLSKKAMQKMIPYLKEGAVYSEAATKAGYDFRGHFNGGKSETLPSLPQDLPEVTSPVVRRALSQSIQVINAIIRRYGPPMTINIELAREMSKNFQDRQAIEKMQLENRSKNERTKDDLRELGVPNPTHLDIVRYNLWKDQDGRCLYSGNPIPINRLFETGYAEIDHIVPYSISFDDSYLNKALVLSSENQKKKNRLPLQYLEGKYRDNFIIRVKTTVRNLRKRNNLLMETLPDAEHANEFKEHSLTDTKFITRFLMNYINDHLAFDENNKAKRHVFPVNGAVTAYMRTRWGLNKVRANGDLHHALDAVVIACITPGTVQKVTRYAKKHELMDKEDHFPKPWDCFTEEVEMRLSEDPAWYLKNKPLPNYDDTDLKTIKPVFVSRYRKKKKTGAAHMETIRGVQTIDDVSYTVSKVPLTALKLKDGEILNYYRPEDDRLLYEKLRGLLIAADGKAKDAFTTPVTKPTPKGGPAPIVKKVKIMEKATSTVYVADGHGVAANGSMVRVDVYFVEGEGYYLVPIYVADLIKKPLPSKAIVAYKPMSDWKQMIPENFIFSLYPNDLIHVEFKKEKEFKLVNNDSTLPKTKYFKNAMLYYRSADIATGAIEVINHDNTYKLRGLGVKTLPKIEKYGVDVLGNIQPIGRERRPE